MAKSLPLQTAITLSLGELKEPVVTSYQLGLMVYKFYLKPTYYGQNLNLRKSQPDLREYYRSVGDLIENGVLKELRGLRHVYSVLGKKNLSPEDIACTVDPFAYISHLSAMEYHGLTDRIPKLLLISTPPPKKWSMYAQERMKKDLGEELIEQYNNSNFPKLSRIRMSKINNVRVVCYSSVHLGAFKLIKNRMIRVSTIGRTFLDMLRRPDLCGGIYHVLDVFKQYANNYLSLILDEFDQHGKQIDKVRAGYVLEEICKTENERIETWSKFAQRGGSRKLDSTAEYSSNYSERWCLSINIEKE
jgi:predicted transcriptional regulator of viral defense system